MTHEQASEVVGLLFAIAIMVAFITGAAITWYIQQFTKRR